MTSKNLTPAIVERTNALIDAALRIALGAPSHPPAAMFGTMRDAADDVLAAATALHELLEIQDDTPAEAGYTPADAAKVSHAVRAHALAAIVAKTGAVPAPGAPKGFVTFNAAVVR